jgi:nicotinamide-nucleotide amidase
MSETASCAAAEAVLATCRAAGLHIATAESCTGGLIAAALTAIAGSSDVFERGFVTYSNEAKIEMLGVDPGLIAAEGAVSEACARAMAAGALARSAADLAISVTGIAGPGGASAAKPVGLVWFGLARRDRPVAAWRQIFPGDRAAVRRAAVLQALTLLRGATG